MGTTANYGFHIVESASEYFRDWRERLNGALASDLEKIDEVLAGKADDIIYDPDAHTIQLSSLGEAIGDPIEVGKGAIDPDEKTAVMTQPVGVDSDGKLWTAPSGEGGSSSADAADIIDLDGIESIVSEAYVEVFGGAS